MADPKKKEIIVSVSEADFMILDSYCEEYLGSPLNDILQMKTDQFVFRCEEKIKSIQTHVSRLQKLIDD